VQKKARKKSASLHGGMESKQELVERSLITRRRAGQQYKGRKGCIR
jgi:hypothetical protein